jgi:hypothetical protein
MDGLEQEESRVPPSLNISNDLPEFILKRIGVRFVALTTKLRRWSKQGRPISIFLVCLGTAANMLAALSVTRTLRVLPRSPAMTLTT